MRETVSLKEAGGVSGMAPAAILTEQKRGNIPLDTKNGISLDGLITLLLCIELRRQTPSNKEIGKKAMAAVAPTRHALAEYLNNGDMPAAVLITILPPSEQGRTWFVKGWKEIEEIQIDALERGLSVQIVPLARIILQVAQAFELTPAALPPNLAVEHANINKPSTPHRNTNALVAYLAGQGLGAAEWRDLGQRADAIADALEPPEQPPGLTIERVDFDEPVTGARWSPEGLVFCLAGRGLRLRTSAAGWKSFAGEAAAFAAARGQPAGPTHEISPPSTWP
jgi:hypothetical protein